MKCQHCKHGKIRCGRSGDGRCFYCGVTFGAAYIDFVLAPQQRKAGRKNNAANDSNIKRKARVKA